LILFLILPLTAAFAEEGAGSLISPGALAGPHAKYEGIGNCTKCHKLRGGVPDANCLGCHDKLAAKIKDKKGLHSKYTEQCISCHSDHKGRKFKMVSLEEGKFSHNRTEYPLEGKHSGVACRKCHKKEGVYTAASTECISCHKDEHKGRLDRDCGRCHNFTGWKDIGKFNHDTGSNYALTWKHGTVKCEKCHAEGRYKPLNFKKCDDCHKDVHKKQFQAKTCESCHDTKGWKEALFNHNAPAYKGYKLDGRHLEVKCEKCHTNGRYKQIASKNCKDCHSDTHKGQFVDRTCESCHTTKGWKDKEVLFDHNAPLYKGYKLDGRHLEVKCEKCHTNGRYRQIASKNCKDCHSDTHKGQFVDRTCESCHTTKGWKDKEVLFEHNAPQYKGYKLDGRHLEVKCEKCHVAGKYKQVSDVCLSCHEKDDVHKKELGEVCKKCHTTADWKKTELDHNLQTKFPLIGKHKDTSCVKCHENKRYKTKAETCADCHKDYHKGQFKEGCDSCHTQTDWEPRNFDHRKKTGYELGGVHNDIVCASCHKKKGTYKDVGRNCSQCHVDRHLNQFGVAECSQCHSQNSWDVSRFKHDKTGFPLSGAHRAADCQDCHKNRFYRNISGLCISCHANAYNSAPGHASRGFSQDCRQCHGSHLVTWKAAHPASGCAACHMTDRPSSHAANPLVYPATCELCHMVSSWTATRHVSVSNCSSCHLSRRPASHTANPAKYSTTCEDCHRYPTWTFTHSSGATICSSCHLTDRPSTHVGNPSRYPATCEDCHRYPVWTFVHPVSGVSCSACHAADAPSAHVSYSNRFGSLCENCHRYPSWLPGTMNHSFTAFPTTHKGSSSCGDCHLGQNYGNKGGCIECHTARGADVHNTSVNSGCLSCHPTGRE
ncbi:MAG: hypothetical protein NUW09_03740, partial [Deltaproteobacteria bacterium]|nr:hypothetical protein [Deltaproteobacteria bacterium]